MVGWVAKGRKWTGVHGKVRVVLGGVVSGVDEEVRISLSVRGTDLGVEVVRRLGGGSGSRFGGEVGWRVRGCRKKCMVARVFGFRFRRDNHVHLGCIGVLVGG